MFSKLINFDWFQTKNREIVLGLDSKSYALGPVLPALFASICFQAQVRFKIKRSKFLVELIIHM